MSDSISYRLEDGTAWITLGDSASGNSIDLPFVHGLLRAVRNAQSDEVHVVVIAAEGKAFSVGGDLEGFASAADPARLIDDLADALHRVISELHRMEAVVIAAVQGTAAGAGLALAAAADLVVAADSARFTLAYTAVGLSPDGGSSLLPATVGLHRALHLALLNPVLTAEQARTTGLVAEVYAAESFSTSVRALVNKLREGSRDAQVATKRLMRESALVAPETALRRETIAIRKCAATANGREGVKAFIEKRTPRYS